MNIQLNHQRIIKPFIYRFCKVKKGKYILFCALLLVNFSADENISLFNLKVQ